MKRITTQQIAASAAAATANLVGDTPAAEVKKSSHQLPVDIKEHFASTEARLKSEKAALMHRQPALLESRCDVSNQVGPSRGSIADARGYGGVFNLFLLHRPTATLT